MKATRYRAYSCGCCTLDEIVATFRSELERVLPAGTQVADAGGCWWCR